MTSSLATLTLTQASAKLKSREISSLELTQAVIESAKKRNDELNMYLHIDEAGAYESAKFFDNNPDNYDSPLAGVPIAVKDTIITRGLPTTAGSKMLNDYVPPFDATVINKLKSAGSIIIGKTNCDEFAMGASGENSAYGPTKNPVDPRRVPGGSSSGSAAAVAADAAIAALGSDTGGSVRQPAGFCGVVGLRPTYGLVSRYGLIAMASSIDTIGPITKTADDAAAVLSVIAGPDDNDSTTHQSKKLIADKLLKEKIKGLTIGVPKQFFPEAMDESVKGLVWRAIDKFKDMGLKIKEIDLKMSKLSLATYYVIVPSEVSTNLARYDGLRYGQTTRKINGLLDLYKANRSLFGAEAKRRIMIGTFSLSSGYADKYYLQAAKVRRLIYNEFKLAFNDVDLIASPTSPTTAFKLGEKFNDPLTMYLSDVLTAPAGMAGLPAISINAGLVNKLPVGLQLIGPWLNEGRILSAASAWEKLK
ncbi:Asp-tRNA(Asn)/Glu-tRNA(Gln) amidotransferase subunit GatA [Patescibacteria group bacterium]